MSKHVAACSIKVTTITFFADRKKNSITLWTFQALQ